VNVYELTSVLDDPRFDEFDFDELPSLFQNQYLYQDFKGEDWTRINKLDWQPPFFSSKWSPVPVVGSVGEYVDYTTVSRVPTFSHRAVKALEEFLVPNGELLEILPKRSRQRYYAYNILTKSDSLDVQRSRFESRGDPAEDTASRISFFSFDEARLAELSIFRIREYPKAVFVTETFKDRVDKAGLNGFYFIKVYPYNEDEDWERIEVRRSRDRRDRLNAIRGNTAVLHLSTASKSQSEEEENAAMTFALKISELLAEEHKTLTGDFLGAIEQLDIGRRELLIVMVCADVDRLAGFLESKISKSDWAQPMWLEKIYGGYYDRKAERQKMTFAR
jgi:hypothetical protein